MQAEQEAMLHQAVLRIPVALRMVLVLHDMEELTTEEVAQVLALKPGTVRVRLHRARLAARKEMRSAASEHSTLRKPMGKNEHHPRVAGNGRPAACRDLFAQLSEYLDGRVEPATCEEMEKHIEGCPACVAFLQDLRGAIDRCRGLKLQCDPAVANRLRTVLTREYVRLITAPPGNRA